MSDAHPTRARRDANSEVKEQQVSDEDTKQSIKDLTDALKALIMRVDKLSAPAAVVHAPSSSDSPPPNPPTSRLQFNTEEIPPSRAKESAFVTPRSFLPFSSPQRVEHSSSSSASNRPQATVVADVSTHSNDYRSKATKAPEPKKFRGTDVDRMGAKQWLRSVDDYLSITASNQSQGNLVKLFGLNLEGPALTWFHIQREKEGEGWTLDRVYADFLDLYTGGVTQSLLESKLEGLKYNRSKDLTSFNAEHEGLISQVFPEEWARGGENTLLAKTYENIIKNGDIELWMEAKRANPKSLVEWRAAVQNAYVLLREIGKVKVRGGQSNSWHRSSSSSSTSVRVNQMETGKAESHGEEGETEEREEGQAESLNAMRSARGGKEKGKSRPGNIRYTDEEYEVLKKSNLCLYCVKPGHRVKECPDRAAGKPRTKATPEQLKL
jgi:hypothetical protein